MTINFTTLFTQLGKAAWAAKQAEEVTDLVATGAHQALFAAARQNLIDTVEVDNPQPDQSLPTALRELIRQMAAASESLEASAVSSSVSAGAGNVGNGSIIVGLRHTTGVALVHAYDEDLEAIAQPGGSLLVAGERLLYQPADYGWPSGSGRSTILADVQDENLLSNWTFEEADAVATTHPDGWTLASGSASGVVLSSVEVQRIVVSGPPTAGYYVLIWVDSFGESHRTAPLAYNATGAQVQAALRDLPELGAIEVSTTGTTPNYTHDITFSEAPNPTQLTSDNQTTGGTFTHSTPTAGSASAKRGARVVTLTNAGIQQPVALEPNTVYAVLAYSSSAVVTVALVDGVGGSVLTDDAGNSLTFTGGAAGWQSGMFATPRTIPQQPYLRITATTAAAVDRIVLAPAQQLYPGGPWLAQYNGLVAWSPDDRLTVAITNNRAGELNEWANRAWGLADLGLYLPVSGSPTQADSLIA